MTCIYDEGKDHLYPACLKGRYLDQNGKMAIKPGNLRQSSAWSSDGSKSDWNRFHVLIKWPSFFEAIFDRFIHDEACCTFVLSSLSHTENEGHESQYNGLGRKPLIFCSFELAIDVTGVGVVGVVL